jgi:UDP-N-acetylglucosamine acyltransferase
MREIAANTVGGGVDQTAVIGHAPESRDWKPGDPAWRPIISPTARVEAFVSVDSGTKRPTSIGSGAWLMKHVHVGHDAIVGQDCELSPGVIVGGFAELGRGVRVGMGAVIRNRVVIGAGARIGMGAVVVADVPAGATVVSYPPAKPIGSAGWEERAA